MTWRVNLEPFILSLVCQVRKKKAVASVSGARKWGAIGVRACFLE